MPTEALRGCWILWSGVLMIMNHHVGTGNQTQVLRKSNKCSELLISLQLPYFYFYPSGVS